MDGGEILIWIFQETGFQLGFTRLILVTVTSVSGAGVSLDLTPVLPTPGNGMTCRLVARA